MRAQKKRKSPETTHRPWVLPRGKGKCAWIDIDGKHKGQLPLSTMTSEVAGGGIEEERDRGGWGGCLLEARRPFDMGRRGPLEGFAASATVVASVMVISAAPVVATARSPDGMPTSLSRRVA